MDALAIAGGVGVVGGGAYAIAAATSKKKECIPNCKNKECGHDGCFDKDGNQTLCGPYLDKERGHCRAGENGSTYVECKKGFTHDLFGQEYCNVCKQNLAGKDCSIECNKCVNGICNDGINGNGQCICFNNWEGKLCDQCPDNNCTSETYAIDINTIDKVENNLSDKFNGFGDNKQLYLWLKSNDNTRKDSYLFEVESITKVNDNTTEFDDTNESIVVTNTIKNIDYNKVKDDIEWLNVFENFLKKDFAVSFGVPLSRIDIKFYEGSFKFDVIVHKCYGNFTGKDCDKCRTNFDKNNNCDTCIDGNWGELCEKTCKVNNLTCNNHGECKRNSGCECEVGWKGEFCEIECPVKNGNVCNNNGDCDDEGKCQCNGNYKGEKCGQCKNKFDISNNCDTCLDGIWGEKCNKECPKVDGKICNGHGKCNDGLDGDGKCVCDDGWKGELCNIECPKINNKVCNNKGKCLENGTCQCNGNYKGEKCGQCKNKFDISNNCDTCLDGIWGEKCNKECPKVDGKICNNQGTCNDNVNGDGTCQCYGNFTGDKCNICKQGWKGDNCDTCEDGYYGENCDRCPVNPNNDTVCNNKGSCNDGIDGDGQCVCNSGWGGDNCINGCPKVGDVLCGIHGDCRDDGTCKCHDSNEKGHWALDDKGTCTLCKPGYYGQDCKEECPKVDGIYCGNHGICNDGLDGDGTCKCNIGWDPSSNCAVCDSSYRGSNCDLKCPEEGCGDFGMCIEDPDTKDKAICECNDGYYGENCNECINCEHGECNDGKSGDGTCVCDDSDEKGHWKLDENGSCTLCKPGWYGIDCKQKCECIGICNDGKYGDGTCTCTSEFEKDEDGNCTQCKYGRYGSNCDRCPAFTQDGSDNPIEVCNGNGTCDQGLTGKGVCTCDPGWKGAECEKECPKVDGKICNNHGECNYYANCECHDDNINGHWVGTKCDQCKKGWTGSNCDQCDTGYYGNDCDQCPGFQEDESGNVTVCNGHGECNDGLTGDGNCVCDDGWEGVDEEDENINVCNICEKGYYGPTCTKCPTENGKICNAKGTCNDGLEGDGTCECEEGWNNGSNCTICNGNYYGEKCTKCPGFEKDESGNITVCHGNGTCNDGINGNGQCRCYDSEQKGYWDPDTDCEKCQPNHAGPICQYNDNDTCNSHGIAQGGSNNKTNDDEIRDGQEGTCVCDSDNTKGYWDAAHNCKTCIDGWGGEDCACEDSVVCNANGICDDTPQVYRDPHTFPNGITDQSENYIQEPYIERADDYTCTCDPESNLTNESRCTNCEETNTIKYVKRTNYDNRCHICKCNHNIDDCEGDSNKSTGLCQHEQIGITYYLNEKLTDESDKIMLHPNNKINKCTDVINTNCFPERGVVKINNELIKYNNVDEGDGAREPPLAHSLTIESRGYGWTNQDDHQNMSNVRLVKSECPSINQFTTINNNNCQSKLFFENAQEYRAESDLQNSVGIRFRSDSNDEILSGSIDSNSPWKLDGGDITKQHSTTCNNAGTTYTGICNQCETVSICEDPAVSVERNNCRLLLTNKDARESEGLQCITTSGSEHCMSYLSNKNGDNLSLDINNCNLALQSVVDRNSNCNGMFGEGCSYTRNDIYPRSECAFKIDNNLTDFLELSWNKNQYPKGKKIHGIVFQGYGKSRTERMIILFEHRKDYDNARTGKFYKDNNNHNYSCINKGNEYEECQRLTETTCGNNRKCEWDSKDKFCYYNDQNNNKWNNVTTSLQGVSSYDTTCNDGVDTDNNNHRKERGRGRHQYTDNSFCNAGSYIDGNSNNVMCKGSDYSKDGDTDEYQSINEFNSNSIIDWDKSKQLGLVKITNGGMYVFKKVEISDADDGGAENVGDVIQGIVFKKPLYVNSIRILPQYGTVYGNEKFACNPKLRAGVISDREDIIDSYKSSYTWEFTDRFNWLNVEQQCQSYCENNRDTCVGYSYNNNDNTCTIFDTDTKDSIKNNVQKTQLIKSQGNFGDESIQNIISDNNQVLLCGENGECKIKTSSNPDQPSSNNDAVCTSLRQYRPYNDYDIQCDQCVGGWENDGQGGKCNICKPNFDKFNNCETCVQGRYGKDCESVCDDSLDCGLHGKCDNSPDISAQRCKCDKGWTGTNCEKCDDNYAGKYCTKECPYRVQGNEYLICNGIEEGGICNDGIDGDGTCTCFTKYLPTDGNIKRDDICHNDYCSDKTTKNQCEGPDAYGTCNWDSINEKCTKKPQYVCDTRNKWLDSGWKISTYANNNCNDCIDLSQINEKHDDDITIIGGKFKSVTLTHYKGINCECHDGTSDVYCGLKVINNNFNFKTGICMDIETSDENVNLWGYNGELFNNIFSKDNDDGSIKVGQHIKFTDDNNLEINIDKIETDQNDMKLVINTLQTLENIGIIKLSTKGDTNNKTEYISYRNFNNIDNQFVFNNIERSLFGSDIIDQNEMINVNFLSYREISPKDLTTNSQTNTDNGSYRHILTGDATGISQREIIMNQRYSDKYSTNNSLYKDHKGNKCLCVNEYDDFCKQFDGDIAKCGYNIGCYYDGDTNKCKSKGHWSGVSCNQCADGFYGKLCNQEVKNDEVLHIDQSENNITITNDTLTVKGTGFNHSYIPRTHHTYTLNSVENNKRDNYNSLQTVKIEYISHDSDEIRFKIINGKDILEKYSSDNPFYINCECFGNGKREGGRDGSGICICDGNWELSNSGTGEDALCLRCSDGWSGDNCDLSNKTTCNNKGYLKEYAYGRFIQLEGTNLKDQIKDQIKIQNDQKLTTLNIISKIINTNGKILFEIDYQDEIRNMDILVKDSPPADFTINKITIWDHDKNNPTWSTSTDIPEHTTTRGNYKVSVNTKQPDIHCQCINPNIDNTMKCDGGWEPDASGNNCDRCPKGTGECDYTCQSNKELIRFRGDLSKTSVISENHTRDNYKIIKCDERPISLPNNVTVNNFSQPTIKSTKNNDGTFNNEISIFTYDNTPWNGDVVYRCYKDGECTLNEKRTACNNCKDGWYGDICKFNKFNKCNGHGEVTVNNDKTLSCECDQGWSGKNCEKPCLNANCEDMKYQDIKIKYNSSENHVTQITNRLINSYIDDEYKNKSVDDKNSFKENKRTELNDICRGLWNMKCSDKSKDVKRLMQYKVYEDAITNKMNEFISDEITNLSNNKPNEDEIKNIADDINDKYKDILEDVFISSIEFDNSNICNQHTSQNTCDSDITCKWNIDEEICEFRGECPQGKYGSDCTNSCESCGFENSNNCVDYTSQITCDSDITCKWNIDREICEFRGECNDGRFGDGKCKNCTDINYFGSDCERGCSDCGDGGSCSSDGECVCYGDEKTSENYEYSVNLDNIKFETCENKVSKDNCNNDNTCKWIETSGDNEGGCIKKGKWRKCDGNMYGENCNQECPTCPENSKCVSTTANGICYKDTSNSSDDSRYEKVFERSNNTNKTRHLFDIPIENRRFIQILPQRVGNEQISFNVSVITSQEGEINPNAQKRRFFPEDGTGTSVMGGEQKWRPTTYPSDINLNIDLGANYIIKGVYIEGQLNKFKVRHSPDRRSWSNLKRITGNIYRSVMNNIDNQQDCNSEGGEWVNSGECLCDKYFNMNEDQTQCECKSAMCMESYENDIFNDIDNFISKEFNNMGVSEIL